MTARRHCQPAFVVLLLAVALLPEVRSARATSCVNPKLGGPSFGDVITGNALLSYSDLTTGVGYWTGCLTSGTGFPSFLVNASSSTRHVGIINYGVHSNSGLCGLFTPNSSGGGTIEIWSHYFDSRGATVSCGSPSWVIGHELGHELRLGDSPCCSYMMGGCNGLGQVQIDECIAVDGQWMTTIEVETTVPEGPIDEPDDANSDPSCTEPELCTPILIDVEANGYRLSGLGDSVSFDLDADGELERLGWTARDSDDGFLVLDRNSNGKVDDGRELFGAATPQPEVEFPNGFLALAVFDQPSAGGNGDGVISWSDGVYPRLWVWVDHNHDGLSQPTELRTLGSLGIDGIRLDYFEARRRDRHGNEFRWTSRLLKPGVQGQRPCAIDVIFVSGK
jgi:hypothetical protein